jgi:hypothetical protein
MSSFGEYATLIAILVAMGFALRQMRTDPRITKEFRRKSYVAAGLYLLFTACGMGIAAVLLVLGGGRHGVLFLLAFFLDWVSIGVVWLTRTAPRLREPPGWLMRRWSALDWILIAVAVGCLLGAALSL